MSKIYTCECGKKFNSVSALGGHQSHCKTHNIIKYGELDTLNNNESIRQTKAQEVKGLNKTVVRNAKTTQWISEQHVCEKCGKVMTEKFGSGRFCSRACANSRSHLSSEERTRISESVKIANKRYCSTERACERCGEMYVPNNRLRKLCYSCQPKIIVRASAKQIPESILQISSRTLSKIISRMNLPCSCCGFFVSGVVLDLHHIVPRGKGGEDTAHNLTYICPNCHRIAHTDVSLLKKELVPFDIYLSELNLNWRDYYYIHTNKV